MRALQDLHLGQQMPEVFRVATDSPSSLHVLHRWDRERSTRHHIGDLLVPTRLQRGEGGSDSGLHELSINIVHEKQFARVAPQRIQGALGPLVALRRHLQGEPSIRPCGARGIAFP